LFWKKSDKTTVSFSFPNDDECKRTAFRVTPEDDFPIYVRFGEEKTRVVNISAGGMAFENHEFHQGEAHAVELDLPGEYRSVRCTVSVLRIDGTGKICFATFSDMDGDSHDTLHHYVLGQQKRLLQKKRTMPIHGANALLAQNLSDSGSDA